MKKKDIFSSTLIMVLVTLFTIALGYGVILPVLPFYTDRLALGTGATPETIIFHIGFLTSIFPFFQMFFAPIWGRLSDKIGRKPLLIIGVLGFIIMQFLIGISSTLWMLYLARILGGIFTSAVIPVSYALISDLTSDENRARGIAFAGTSYSLGIVAGPFIGGILSQTELHLNFRSSHLLINDFSVPFFFLACLGLILLLFVTKRLKISETTAKPRSTNISSMKWQKIVQMLFPFLFLSFIYQLALTLFESVFSIYSKNELQFDAISIGYGFMICALVMALLQPLVVSHKVNDKIPSKYQIILGFALIGISLSLLVLADQFVIVMILIGLLAAGGAFITPNITSLISLKGGQSSGAALGIQKSIDSLGQVIGPIAGSWLFTIDRSLPYLLTGGSVILITLIIFKNRRLLAIKI